MHLLVSLLLAIAMMDKLVCNSLLCCMLLFFPCSAASRDIQYQEESKVKEMTKEMTCPTYMVPH